jgi:hypothetical protein
LILVFDEYLLHATVGSLITLGPLTPFPIFILFARQGCSVLKTESVGSFETLVPGCPTT